MSDRVAFIGGSVPERDHFPFPIVEEGPLPTTLGFINQMVVFWMVKEWEIIVDHLPSGETDAGPFFLPAYDPDEGSVITREADLVRAVTWGYGYCQDGSRYLKIELAADGTVKFTLKLYELQGEVIGNSDWNDSVTFGDDIDYLYAAVPHEWWPYATKAGLPVYDAATGVQLRDPFS